MDFDGKKLFDLFLYASMPVEAKKIVKVFVKHGIGVSEAMEILFEIMAITEKDKTEGEDDGKSSDG